MPLYLRPRIPILGIDHVVENHNEGTLDNITDWYSRVFELQRFWSIDDNVVHTEFSALKAYLISNDKRSIQITLAEPVPTQRQCRGQIQEFLHFHTSPGVQHIAFTVNDIVSAVAQMKKRSVEFLKFPSTYYKGLRERLASSRLKIKEDLNLIEEYGILMDFDSNGYLLQIFTKPVQSRPTFFIEIIQRHNFEVNYLFN
jgi:4-hydroxyphenylpyruvate dioxygenase